MRFAYALLCGVIFLAPAAYADEKEKDSCNQSWEALSQADRSKLDYGQFESTCQRQEALRAAPATAEKSTHSGVPLGNVSGICKDGSYATSTSRATACARRGGIRIWFLGTR